MATKSIKNVSKDSTTILNGIRSQASPTYQETVPVATTTNLAEVGRAIMAFEATQNEFINALVNRIGLVMVKNLIYTNPLKIFKRGTLEYGQTIEEIFVDLAKSYDYAWESGDDTNIDPFKREIPNVKAIFHSVNRQKTFKTTTTEEQLNLAFTDAEGVYGIVDKIVGSVYAAFEVWEWNEYKSLFKTAFDAVDGVKIEIDEPVDEATVKSLVKQARALSSKMTCPSTAYNKAGVTRTTKREDQVVIITADLEATMDVDVLASAFNMNKTEFLGNLIVIDSFATGMEDVQMMVVDRNWFMVYDKLFKMLSIYNPRLMYWNYFLQVWMVFSYSTFENCVFFVNKTV